MSYTMYNETNVTGMLHWANTTTGGVMGYGWLLVIMSIIVIGSLRYGYNLSRALLAATLVGFIVCAGMTILGIMSSKDFIIMLFLVTFSYIYTYHD